MNYREELRRMLGSKKLSPDAEIVRSLYEMIIQDMESTEVIAEFEILPEEVELNELPFPWIYYVPTSKLFLSQRPYNVLARDEENRTNWSVLGDTSFIGLLIQKTEPELLRTPNLGPKSVNEVIDELQKLNLELGNDNIEDFNPYAISPKLSKYIIKKYEEKYGI